MDRKTQVSTNLNIPVSVEGALAMLNAKLRKRSEEVGFPIGDISIEGVDGSDEEKIVAIKNQYNGIIKRASVERSLPDVI